MEQFNNINILKNTNIYDCSFNNVFVLAGGQIKSGDINSWVKSRLDLSIEIYKRNKCNIYCIGGGTYHKPPILNKFNHVIHESSSCAMYLQKNNINYKHIKKEWSSYDTIGNGFFSFLNFIIPLQLSEICIITSEFHMNRTKGIFNFMKKIFKSDVIINYIETDNNMDTELLELRKNREEKSLVNFNNQMENITSLSDFFNWFYIDHNAYNSIMTEIDNIDDSVKKSY
jgi:hypothetical protein